MAQKGSPRRAEVADDEADVPLQAVLLADSFAQQFCPITDERHKVIIGEDFTVSSLTRISLIRQSPEEDSSDEELESAGGDSGDAAESPPSSFPDGGIVNASTDYLGVEGPEGPRWDLAEVGVGGSGSKWSTGQEEEWRHSVAPIPTENLQDIAACEVEGELEDTAQDLIVPPSNDNAAGVDTDEDADEDDEDAYFQKELENILRRAAVTGESGTQQGLVLLEINALKLAFNRSLSDVLCTISLEDMGMSGMPVVGDRGASNSTAVPGSPLETRA